jgi:hypothetical protein
VTALGFWLLTWSSECQFNFGKRPVVPEIQNIQSLFGQIVHQGRSCAGLTLYQHPEVQKLKSCVKMKDLQSGEEIIIAFSRNQD